jgi:tRNA 5-methylaminomethyl-2-thiouridine biosynthesis bifunctional protein
MEAGGAQRDQASATRWQSLATWRVLNTDFGDGQAFFAKWLAWQQDAQRPRMLHYVAFCPSPVAAAVLIDRCGNNPERQALARTLAAQWFGLVAGFHRFLLADGHVCLTLCVGQAMHLLRQQQFRADSVLLWCNPDDRPDALDPLSLWSVKALARCCRRGTSLRAIQAQPTDLPMLRSHLKQCGFAVTAETALTNGAAQYQLEAVFDPPWTLKASRQPASTDALPIQRCAVIGAGLAGASVAAALARRGWQVWVLDQAATAAAGASGLPVGLVLPHVSPDDCHLSRLSRAGVRMMLQQARWHLQTGQQWAPSGVLERQIGGTPQLPAPWSDAGKDWSRPGNNALIDPAAEALTPGIWHASGAWIKPAELVNAWLATPGVHFLGNAGVGSLQHAAGVWQLLDESGVVLCTAERVVLANACGARDLLKSLASDEPDLAVRLQHLPATQGMRGLLSWAWHTEAVDPALAFPPFPVNGAGSLISKIPLGDRSGWFTGSSYQPENQLERSDTDNHDRNFAHLQQLVPTLARALAPVFASTAINTWKGSRCVSTDRMPLVGPLDAGPQPSLWICAAMGSRGLSFSVLCAELLAARMGAEPLPVEASLAAALDALRG